MADDDRKYTRPRPDDDRRYTRPRPTRRRPYFPELLGDQSTGLRRVLQEEELRRQDVADAVAWLEEKWRKQACPYCRVADWRVGTPLEIQIVPDGAMSPAFPVMCGNCGHTTFVNAIVAGLRKDEQ